MKRKLDNTITKFDPELDQVDFDIGRYESAAGWEPSDKYAKLRDEYRKKHAFQLSPHNMLAGRRFSEWMKTGKTDVAVPKLFGDLWRVGELAIMFADTGVGKSILAVQITESIARGVPVEPLEMTAPAQRVLYLDFELSTDQLVERYSRSSADGSRFVDPYRFSSRSERYEIKWNKELPAEFATMSDFMAFSIQRRINETGAKVVIIDNISWLNSANTSASEALKLIKGLKAIKTQYGVSILVIAHTVKRPFGRPLTENELGGAKPLVNHVDNLFAVGKSSVSPDLRYIKHIKQRNCRAVYDASNVIGCRLEKPRNFPRFTFVEFSTERRHLTSPYDNANADRAHLKAEAHRLAAEGRTEREIAESLRVGKTTVHRYLTETDTQSR